MGTHVDKRHRTTTTISQNAIDDKLWALHSACVKYQGVNHLARLVLFAIADYINTDKAPRKFIADFVSYPDSRFEDLIRCCLSGDRSANGIIKSCQKVFARI